MKINCNIIEDLLPLYAENICSEESRTLVEEHCSKCESCRSRLEAQNIPLPEKKISRGAKDPLKKTKRHYIRLAAVTAIICVVVSVPLWKVFELTVGEILQNHSMSWTYLKMENEMKKFAKQFMKGDYKAALDMAGFAYQTRNGTYLPYGFDDGGERLRSDYAAYLAEFIRKYPIERSEVEAHSTASVQEGYIYFFIDKDHADGAPVAIHFRFLFSDGQLYIKTCYISLQASFDTGTSKQDRDAAMEKYREVYYDLSEEFCSLLLYGDDFTESFGSMIENGSYEEAFDRSGSIIYSSEYMELNSEQWIRSSEYYDSPNDELLKEMEDIRLRADNCRRQLMEKTRELLSENYTCVSVSGSDPYFSIDPHDKGTVFEEPGSFKQDITLNMEASDRTQFWVTFTAQTDIAAKAPFTNITYSDNTPEQFRHDFEDVFR